MTQKINRLNDWRWIVEQQSVCNVDSASESSLSSAESAILTSGARLHQRHSFNLFMPTDLKFRDFCEFRGSKKILFYFCAKRIPSISPKLLNSVEINSAI